MQKPSVRVATREDAEAIEIIIGEWATQHWPSWQVDRTGTILRVLKDRNHSLLVSVAPEGIVGVLHLIFYEDVVTGSLKSHVNLLLVKEGHRGMRIGHLLLDEAAKQSRKRGANEMHVDTMFKEAAEFYRKYGFEDDGVWLELPLREEKKA
jgi:GNAT superfamily N-acetyltransferase